MASFYQSIDGWFDFDDIYDLALRRCGNKSAHFVEVGAYKGRSTCYMAERIRESGLEVQFDVVDTFAGDVHTGKADLWPCFAANLERAGLLSTLRTNRCLSIDAARIFGDESLDFVFIDAEHTRRAVEQDLSAWWPKVRPGGLLAGHDYAYFADVASTVDEFVAKNRLANAFRTTRSSWMVYKSLRVDGAYCINLPRRHDRRASAQRQFHDAGMAGRIEFFDALDGRTLTHPSVISDGQAGCCASHLAVLHKAAREGHRHVLIFEDDAELVSNFLPRFEAAFSRLPASYELCYLGALCRTEWGNYLHPFDDLLARAGNVYGMHAYVVNVDCLNMLDAGLRELRNVIDEWLNREILPRANSYACIPYLAFQAAGMSDIAGTFNVDPRKCAEYVWR